MTPTINDEALVHAAYKGERVASRRLAARDGIPEMAALRQTLTELAGPQGLAALLAERTALQLRDAARREQKQQDKAAQLAARQAGRQPAADAWCGWFDGSAHPNPGRIGIGAVLCGPAGQRLEISRREGYGNSGEAEYLALTALLEAALPMRPPVLVVYGDSQVVVNDVNQGQAGAKGLEGHRARVVQLLAQLDKVSLCWIPRHRNGVADQLSQRAAAGAHPDDDAGRDGEQQDAPWRPELQIR